MTKHNIYWLVCV